MDAEKPVGYVLLFFGIVMMLSSLFLAYIVFNGTTKPPELLNIQGQNGTSMSIGGIEMPSIEVLPPEYLNQSGNLSLYLAFMFFVAYVGGMIASLGVRMIKEERKQN